jgi:hypothetical protein
MTITADLVARQLAHLRDRIAGAGGDPGRVTVVAVTKGMGPDAVVAALACGLWEIGENYAQELLAKREGIEPGPRWHLIGPVQRNKVRALAPAVSSWDAVDRLAAGETIARFAPGARVLVQVNTTGEATKSGCRPEVAPELVDQLGRLGLDVAGLMTIGPPGPPDAARPAFASLRALADSLELPERSMGMSADLEVAVQEGATQLRVGSALFGPRLGRPGLRR